MGCTQSLIEDDEAVARCKDRRAFIAAAVAARHSFAAAHFSYTVSLKNIGAALGDYAHGEAHVHDLPHRTSTANAAAAAGANTAVASSSSTVALPVDNLNLPPPPPPLPDFSPSPLQRSTSMPDFKPKSKYMLDVSEMEDTILEENHDHDEHDVVSVPSSPVVAEAATVKPPPPMPESKGLTWDYFFVMDESTMAEPPPPPPPPPPPMLAESVPVTPVKAAEKVVVEEEVEEEIAPAAKKGKVAGHQHSESMGVLEVKGKMVVTSVVGVNLVDVMLEIDEHFLKASESAHEVWKTLEVKGNTANRRHYEANFADNRGVMNAITWNRSFRGLPIGNDAEDDHFNSDKWETHATVLDKMLDWEKKLCKEVKAGELMKIEYQRKVGLLNKQTKRGTNPEAINRTKAAVSHLHTRYIVDMESMDSTVSEIQHLRDQLLFAKLSELIDGMIIMWETMHQHHVEQLIITSKFKGLDILNATKETSERHYDRTNQLYEMAKEWRAQFEKLVSHQREYVDILNSWLKLSIIPIESGMKEQASPTSGPHQLLIVALLLAWRDGLEKLPDDLAKSAISSFAAVLNTIMTLQQEELNQKVKSVEIRKEYTRKVRAFEDWYHKKSPRVEEAAPADGGEGSNPKDPVTERRFQVETLKSKVDEEEDAHRKLCKQVREKSHGSFKTHLPELFRAMSDFALSCSVMYKKLKSISQQESQGTK